MAHILHIDESRARLDTFSMSVEIPLPFRPARARSMMRAALLGVLGLVLAPSGLLAEPVTGPGVPAAAAKAVPHKLPHDKRTQLEALFAALKVAPDESSSKEIADRLDQIFQDSGSPSADLLMARASVAAEAKQYDLALEILDQVIAFEPDFIGARSKRATILYLTDEYGAALADIREVLAREPRHWAMLYGLALILRDIDEEKRALAAVRAALAINPHIDGAATMEKELSLKVEGRDI